MLSHQLYCQEYATQTWNLTPNLKQIGEANFVEYDFDKDGTMELICPSTTQFESVIKILDYYNGDYQEEVLIPINENRVNWIELYDLDGDGIPFLYVARENATIEVYDLEQKSTIDTLTLKYPVEEFYFVDRGNDGTFEIVAGIGDVIYLLDDQGNELLKREMDWLYDIAIGDVDNDGETEIIASGEFGLVLNLSDFAEEWRYSEGFGREIVISELDGNQQKFIIGYEAFDIVRCYDAIQQSNPWYLYTEGGIKEIKVTDINQDDQLELLVTKRHGYPSIHCYKLENREYLWDVEVDDHVYSDLGVADIDADGAFEIVFGNSAMHSTGDHIIIVDADKLKVEWISAGVKGFNLDIGHFNDDAYEDLLVVPQSSGNINRKALWYFYDGMNKNKLFEEIIPQSFDIRSVKDADILNYNGTTYSMVLGTDFYYIYNHNSTLKIVNEYFSTNSIQRGELFYSDNQTYPQVALFYFNGSVKVFDLVNENLVESWSTELVSMNIKDFKIGNFDSDEADELAILSSEGQFTAIDLETYEEEVQFQLSNEEASAIEVADIDLDGSMEILFDSKSNSIRIHNYETSEFEGFRRLDGNSLASFEVKNIDADRKKEIIAITDEGFFIYNDSNTILYHYELHNPKYDNETILIRDIDNDQHIEIFAVVENGIVEFEVNEAQAQDSKLPQVTKHLPLREESPIAPRTSFIIKFDEEMSMANVEDFIEVKNSGGDLLANTLDYDPDLNELTINPQTSWTQNDTISCTVKNELSDLAGNHLDGNNNGIEDGSVDNFSWSIITSSGSDNNGPEILDVSSNYTVYQGIPIDVSGIANDAINSPNTYIKRIESFFNETPVPGQGDVIDPIDGFNDQKIEYFKQTLNTFDINYGSHQLHIVAQDALENWGPATEVDIEILEEDSANWTSYSYDLLNTSSNNYSNINLPLTLKYQSIHNKSGLFNEVNKSIVFEDYLLYTVNHSSEDHELFCKEISTGEIVWHKTFDVSGDLHQMAASYGLLYLPVGDSGLQLNCYNIESGDMIWSTEFGDGLYESYGPVVYNGIVYILDNRSETYIRAYDAFSGELIWNKEINEDAYFKVSMAIYNDTLYTYTNQILALNPKNGELYFKRDSESIPAGSNSWSTNTIVDSSRDQLILISADYIHGFSLEGDSINWTIEASEDVNFTWAPAIYKDELFVYTGDHISVYSVISGEMNWSHSFNETLFYQYEPAVNENLLFVPRNDKTYCFNIKNHNLIQTYSIGGHVTISRDHLIIGSPHQGELVVLEYEDGTSADYSQIEPNFINVFPTLSKNLVMIESNQILENVSIRVFDLSGIELITKQYDRWSGNNLSLDHLPSGYYFIHISNSEYSYSEKVLLSNE